MRLRMIKILLFLPCITLDGLFLGMRNGILQKLQRNNKI
jgi:hypothetical protein